MREAAQQKAASSGIPDPGILAAVGIRDLAQQPVTNGFQALGQAQKLDRRSVLALQRCAGNAAVAAVLQRRAGAKASVQKDDCAGGCGCGGACGDRDSDEREQYAPATAQRLAAGGADDPPPHGSRSDIRVASLPPLGTIQAADGRHLAGIQRQAAQQVPGVAQGGTEAITVGATPIEVTAEDSRSWLDGVSRALSGGAVAGHTLITPRFSFTEAGGRVTAVNVTVQIDIKTAVPFRGPTISDSQWQVVQIMARFINEHEKRHAAIARRDYTGIGSRVLQEANRTLQAARAAGAPGGAAAAVAAAVTGERCRSAGPQEALDAAEGNLAVTRDGESFYVIGYVANYHRGCPAGR